MITAESEKKLLETLAKAKEANKTKFGQAISGNNAFDAMYLQGVVDGLEKAERMVREAKEVY